MQAVRPLGYPESAAACGITGCNKPGLLWLDSDEAAAYEDGARVFELPSQGTKVRVTQEKALDR